MGELPALIIDSRHRFFRSPRKLRLAPGFHTLLARVAEGSEESLHLNMSMGFVHIGTLKEVGRKFDRLIDVHILEKMLGQSAHDK